MLYCDVRRLTLHPEIRRSNSDSLPLAFHPFLSIRPTLEPSSLRRISFDPTLTICA